MRIKTCRSLLSPVLISKNRSFGTYQAMIDIVKIPSTLQSNSNKYEIQSQSIGVNKLLKLNGLSNRDLYLLDLFNTNTEGRQSPVLRIKSSTGQ